MKTAFDPTQGLVIVKAKLWGPAGAMNLRLALDTGATITTENAGILIAMGYDPETASDRVRVTTGSGIESAPRVMISKATFLGHQRMDSLRNHRLLLDFLKGHISLN